MDVIADSLDLGLQDKVFCGSRVGKGLLLLLEGNLLLEEIVGVFLGLRDMVVSKVGL